MPKLPSRKPYPSLTLSTPVSLALSVLRAGELRRRRSSLSFFVSRAEWRWRSSLSLSRVPSSDGARLSLFVSLVSARNAGRRIAVHRLVEWGGGSEILLEGGSQRRLVEVEAVSGSPALDLWRNRARMPHEERIHAGASLWR